MIYLTINGQEMTGTLTAPLVSGQVNFVDVKTFFDSTWDGLNKSYQFKNGDRVVELESNDEIIQLPYEATLDAGSMEINVFGTLLDTDGVTVLRKATANYLRFKVIDSNTVDDPDNIGDVSATTVEQIRNIAESAEEKANNAEAIANEILAAKESGELDGYSPSAKVETTDTGALITITDKEGTTTAEIFNGGGGGGTSNYNTLYNKPQINGVELSGNKSLDTLGIQPKGNYLTEETDPTVPSYVKEITTDDITNWNNKAEKDDIPQKTSELTNDSNFATTNENNNFSTAQTINGTLTVNGDIVQNGSSYETHAEQVNTKMNNIILREGAVGGMSIDEFAGLVATLYNGIVSGRLGFKADGTAYVGDVGDEQPLLTRDDVSNLTEGQVLTWDSEKLRAIGSSDFVKNTDYATGSKAGVVKVNAVNGLTIFDGIIAVDRANQTEIDARVSAYKPIVPSMLDYAVQSVVGKHETLKQAEYDALETKDENTFYYIEEE